MSSQSQFIRKAKREMPEFIKTAIDNLLKKLDSPINLPYNNHGKVVESRLLRVVQSRESVYSAICDLMDMINIDKNIDSNYKHKIIDGMRTTWEELTKLIVRSEPFKDDYIEIEDESFLDDSPESSTVSDDHFSAISKSIVIASQLAKQIIERISLLDDPESVNEEKIQSYEIPSIPERYAI